MAERIATPFLTARWRYLAMLNFVADPALLRPLVPIGTELDFDRGETFVSVVGFMFLDTRVLGVAIPLHRNFEEVNLRFYVRRKTAEGWRRGVAFIRELVPRFAIATVARVFYNEPYSAMRMRHSISHEQGRLAVEYGWRRGGAWEFLAMTASGEPSDAPHGSHEEFITEHLLGLYGSGKREHRVSGRASALAFVECDDAAPRRRCRGALRAAICPNAECRACFRLHRGRFVSCGKTTQPHVRLSCIVLSRY